VFTEAFAHSICTTRKDQADLLLTRNNDEKREIIGNLQPVGKTFVRCRSRSVCRFGRKVRPDVRNLIASTGLFSVGYSVLIFTIPLFAVTVRSSESELGFIALMYTLPSLFVPILIGKFLDRAKALRIIQLVAIAYALPTLLFLYASDFIQIAGIRAVQGFFGIAFWVAMEKELSDLAPEGDKGRILAIYNMSWAWAFIVGPILGGYLIQEFDYKTAFLIAFLWQVATIVMLVALRPRRIADEDLQSVLSSVQKKRVVSRRPWESSDLSAACLTSGVIGAVLGVLFSLFPAYATFVGFSALETGFLLLLFTASRLATFLGIGFITERVGEHKLMLAGVILSVSVVILGLTIGAELLALGLVVLGVASGMGYTSGLTLVSHSPSDRRGSAIGRYEFSFNLGIALMSQLGGISGDVLGSRSPYLLTGVVPLAGLIALLAIFRGKRTPVRS
jgi:MFS family permease